MLRCGGIKTAHYRVRLNFTPVLDRCEVLWNKIYARKNGTARECRRGDGGDMGIWTDEEIRTLVSMWPTNSVMKIATRLNRRRETIYAKAKWLHKKGVLEDKDFPRSRPINPDLQDFDEVKRDYCRKHHITVAELCARLERDTQFAAELYRLARAAKITRLRPRELDNIRHL